MAQNLAGTAHNFAGMAADQSKVAPDQSETTVDQSETTVDQSKMAVDQSKMAADQSKMAADGAGMTRKRLIGMVAVVVAFSIAGCGRISDDTVRDKDQQRIETSKGMPGNNIPMDPADGR